MYIYTTQTKTVDCDYYQVLVLLAAKVLGTEPAEKA